MHSFDYFEPFASQIGSAILLPGIVFATKIIRVSRVMKSGHSNVLREGKSRDSVLLLIECSVFLVIPVAHSNVPIMGAKDGIFGSPTIPLTKSVAPIYLGRELLYPTHDTELSVRS